MKKVIYHALPAPQFLSYSSLVSQRGFTLIEAIMVMTITAILSVGVALFIRKPVDSYFNLERRVELSDIVDSAVRRVSRDLHLALPNSVRIVASDPTCLEFLPTFGGGRYRADVGNPIVGNVFDTATALSSLDVLGSLTSAPAANDLMVIYNLGITGADAYNRDNMATLAASTATTLAFSPAKQFPFSSPGNRFQLISGTEQAVFYACKTVGTNASGNGTGTMYRLSNYGINSGSPGACPAITATTPILAQNVSSCSFTYASGVTERTGLASIRLGVTKTNETVQIYQDVHVNNVP